MRENDDTDDTDDTTSWQPTRRRDAIKITPLSLPEATLAPSDEEARARPEPHLTYRGGHLLQHVAVTAIYVGSQWRREAHRTFRQRLNQFFEFIVTSSLIDQLTEYDVRTKRIRYGTFTGPIDIAAPEVRHGVSDGWIRTMIVQQASTRALPTPTRNSLYFVFLPPGVRVIQGGGASCQAFCGYHDVIRGQIYYAVVPFPGCRGCTHGLEAYDAMTVTSSHELCEAITDPVPGRGWYDDVYGEIGDIVAWETKTLGGYHIQKEWSNRARAGI